MSTHHTIERLTRAWAGRMAQWPAQLWNENLAAENKNNPGHELALLREKRETTDVRHGDAIWTREPRHLDGPSAANRSS